MHIMLICTRVMLNFLIKIIDQMFGFFVCYRLIDSSPRLVKRNISVIFLEKQKQEANISYLSKGLLFVEAIGSPL